MIAQGEALGCPVAKELPSPEGASPLRHNRARTLSRPFRAGPNIHDPIPGLHPGLSHAALSGLRNAAHDVKPRHDRLGRHINFSALDSSQPLITTNIAAMPFDFVDFDVNTADKPRKLYRVRQP